MQKPGPRNVFYRLHLIEAYGTGMGKIMKAYEGMEERPAIETTKNAFKIILPNINAKYETGNASIPEAESITRNDVIELLGVSTSTASRVIRRMVKSNLLKQNGKARSTKYTIL